ncbi:hypothetical protein BABINDRAFT_160674 [Babjeviella inositovora NRRL Y-12698]|uniref:Uncharacterized protein n=1 Tax=Babjeviella inositovora NRRL Y-12698 TaxID=984486 RepID=A0A1E3QW47_9ASCO|nr:uncharacterized protein BABINDRAFT_160674 [Babjeviella inositovora NRRL Y-12698]ODQ81312.1 hypothetical protein BABINDRAFT_160674 [Babjeviella inositovora NRRL Y-12698]
MGMLDVIPKTLLLSDEVTALGVQTLDPGWRSDPILKICFVMCFLPLTGHSRTHRVISFIAFKFF